MAKIQLSTKRLQLDKTNTTMVISTAIAAFITVCALVATRTFIGKLTYQARVISTMEKANKQLIENVAATQKLVSSYKELTNAQTNILGGSSAGTGARDGDNAKIILDALPSKYDYPALTSSIEKILTGGGYQIVDISGLDQQSTSEQSSSAPQPVEMPFSFGATGSYASIQKLITDLEHSIRPISLISLELSGNDQTLKATVTANTYYQPTKELKFDKTQEVR